MTEYSYSRLPPKESLIRMYIRDKILQSIFNVVTMLAVLSVVVVSYIRFVTDTFDFMFILSTAALFIIIGVYTTRLNNRIQFNQKTRKDTIEKYDEIQAILKALYEQSHDGGSQQNPQN